MRNTICPWLNVHYLGMNVRVYRFMFILHYICQDSICKMKREHTRPPSQKIKQGKYFSIQWRKMKNWNCCTQRLVCIHTIVLNIRIQIIYNWIECGFSLPLQRVSFGIYLILFIQGRTRFKMNIIVHLWYEFLDYAKGIIWTR